MQIIYLVRDFIYSRFNSIIKKTTQLKSDQRIWIDIAAKKTHIWPINIKRPQHHWPLGTYRSKAWWDATSHPLLWLKWRRRGDDKCWRGCRVIGTFIHCWWECKMEWLFWKTAVLQIIKWNLHDPEISLPSIYPRKMKTYLHRAFTWMFRVFIIAGKWIQLKWPSTDE